jgi:uncharacterized protein HemY
MNHDELMANQTWGETVWDWAETRNYWLLLFALPALLGFVGVGVFAFHQFTWGRERAIAATAAVAGQAQTASDHRRAQLAWQNYLRLTRRTEPEPLYHLAQTYAHFGRRADAVAILSALAPPNQDGYAPAHLFLAQALLMPAEVSPEGMRVAEGHLLRLLKAQPQNAEAQQTLGQLYVALGQWEDARKHLSAVVAARPEAALHLALAQRGLGDANASRTWADRAARYFAGRVAQTPTNEAALRLNWADALALMNDFSGAASALESGLKRTRDPTLRAALARVCLGWSESLAREQPGEITRRLEVIRQGLEAMPENLDLLRELALLSGAPGESAAAARAHVNQLLRDGQHAPLLHFCLGDVARQRGDAARARQHLEAALAAAPTVPEIANQLAALLATGSEPDLPRARRLVDGLIAQAPVNPVYRATRGRILLLQGELDSALLDLEFALPLLADATATHTALAQVYERLGLAEIASEHRRRAAGPAGAK